jgi:hypothetical protein
MGNGRFFSIATAAVVVLNLGVVTASSADAAQGGNDLCVAISGGTVQNATVLDVVADGGTAIGDASGGTGNLAAATGNDNENDNGNDRNNRNDNDNRDNDDNGNDNNRNNRNNWSAESVLSLEQRLLQTDTASSGNGGVVTVSADGGAVSIQDVNSGGNAGNAISVGDTVCPGGVKSTAGDGKAPGGNATTGGGGRGGQVRALPKTGVGELGGASGSLILALGALGMMGLSVGSRLDRRAVQIGDR